MGIVKALIKIIIITIQITILLRIILPLTNALPVEANFKEAVAESEAEDRLFMPPRFPYGGLPLYSSGILCLFTDTPYVGGWYGRSCQGPIPPFVLPTPPPSGPPQPTDPPRVPGTMLFMDEYYGYPWRTTTPPTTRPPTTRPPTTRPPTTQPSTLRPENATTGRPRPRPTSTRAPQLRPTTRQPSIQLPMTTVLPPVPYLHPAAPLMPGLRPRTTTTRAPPLRQTTPLPMTTVLPSVPYLHQVAPLMPGFYEERPHNPEQFADYGEPVEGNPWEPDDDEVFIETYGFKPIKPFKLGDPNQ